MFSRMRKGRGLTQFRGLVKKPPMFGKGVTVGHAGDVIAGDPRLPRPVGGGGMAARAHSDGNRPGSSKKAAKRLRRTSAASLRIRMTRGCR